MVCGIAMAWWGWALAYAFFGLGALFGGLGQIVEQSKEGGWVEGVAMSAFVFFLWPLALVSCLFHKAFNS